VELVTARTKQAPFAGDKLFQAKPDESAVLRLPGACDPYESKRLDGLRSRQRREK
jgi:hypothetical protein